MTKLEHLCMALLALVLLGILCLIAYLLPPPQVRLGPNGLPTGENYHSDELFPQGNVKRAALRARKPNQKEKNETN